MIAPHIRVFQLHRAVDHSGVSGTGIVAEGVEFSTGMVALAWLSNWHCVNVYENLETMIQVHGHEGSTRIVFLDS